MLFESSENIDSKHLNTSSQRSNEINKDLQNINKEEKIAATKHQSIRDKLKGYQDVYNSENHTSLDRNSEDTIPLLTLQTPNKLSAESQLPTDKSEVGNDGDELKEIQKSNAQIRKNIEKKEFLEVARNQSEGGSHPEVDSHPEEDSNPKEDSNLVKDIHHEESSEVKTIINHYLQNIDTDKPAGAQDSNDGTIMSEDEKESCASRVIISKIQGASGDTLNGEGLANIDELDQKGKNKNNYVNKIEVSQEVVEPKNLESEVHSKIQSPYDNGNLLQAQPNIESEDQNIFSFLVKEIDSMNSGYDNKEENVLNNKDIELDNSLEKKIIIGETSNTKNEAELKIDKAVEKNTIKNSVYENQYNNLNLNTDASVEVEKRKGLKEIEELNKVAENFPEILKNWKLSDSLNEN